MHRLFIIIVNAIHFSSEDLDIHMQVKFNKVVSIHMCVTIKSGTITDNIPK